MIISRLAWLCAALVAFNTACSSSGGSSSDDVKSGSRWLSPFDNGFYDGDGIQVRLYPSGTTQAFALTLDDPSIGKGTCTGTVDTNYLGADRAHATFTGNTVYVVSSSQMTQKPDCTLTVTRTESGFTIDGPMDIAPYNYDGKLENWQTFNVGYTLSRRADNAMVALYGKPDGSSAPTVDVLAHDDSEIALDIELEGQDLQTLWADFVDPTSVPMQVNGIGVTFNAYGCDWGVLPMLRNGQYELDVSVASGCPAPDSILQLAGHYVPRASPGG